MKAKHLYYSYWGQAGQPYVANVSFYATGDFRAGQKADKIARELRVTKTPRTIMCEGRVVSVLQRGTTSPEG
jgi:hypothetical protein